MKKTFLLTGHYFEGYHGSMIHICEIANELSLRGFDVYIASVEISDDIKNYVKNNISAKLFFIEDLPLDKTFDYALCYHEPILTYLLWKGLKVEHLGIGSLSSFMEKERLGELQKNNIPIFVHSIELKNFYLDKYGISDNDIFIIPNSVPSNYKNTNINKTLKNIAIVSNHLPIEIKEAGNILQKNGYNVDIYGKENIYVPITSEILDKYDLVITIGKTVQYSLYKGIPVYNYDYFGGSGYVTPENIDTEEHYNFSGRSSFRKLSADEIYKEILDGYKFALDNSQKLSIIAKDRYNLSKNLSIILDTLDKTTFKLPEDFKTNTYNIMAKYCAEEIISKKREFKALENIFKDIGIFYKIINKLTFGHCYKNKLNCLKKYIKI